MTNRVTRQQLGWKPYFQQQLTLNELESYHVGRIVEHHRSRVLVMSDNGLISLSHGLQGTELCVGDWILFDEALSLYRPLERQTLFQRKAPGTHHATQLIAANIDMVLIVCSLNHDFNLSRIERYLAIANEAQVEPIVILTKADQCEDSEVKQEQVQALDPYLVVYCVNALIQNDLLALQRHCELGKTLALLGSSGVGKSTLMNTLLNDISMDTGAIREGDSKGRHTTTYRAIKILPQGGLLMDTPGMRELQLSDCEKGVSETFSEISELTELCRFSNCSHESEPGCAVIAALDKGDISSRRWRSYQKLLREQALNGASLAEKHAKDKALGKMINTTQIASRRFKKGY